MEKAYRYRFYPTPEQDRTLGRREIGMATKGRSHRFLGCVP
ncbi:MAG: helix-turn-helix domain-containing protein [Microcystis sp. M179S2]|nr:helix-turn-helix domain-containing protein [Microcystis sp. M179S2]